MLWHRIGRIAISALLAGCLSACNYTDYHKKMSGYDYGSRSKDDPRLLRVKSHGPVQTDPRQHDNLYFEYSGALSRKISALPGINTALVFVTDRNAYVGILTDWSAGGTRAYGGHNRQEQDNAGTMQGGYNADTGGTFWDNRHIAGRYNSYFTHKDVSDISVKLRQTIGDEIRAVHPGVREVHISANREYMNQLVEFAKASWAGKSLDSLTPAFNKLVRYVFGMGTEVPVPLYDLHPAADSPGGIGPEPTGGSVR